MAAGISYVDYTTPSLIEEHRQKYLKQVQEKRNEEILQRSQEKYKKKCYELWRRKR